MYRTRPRISVIVVSFNTRQLLKRCLDSIRESSGTLPYEIIVVDSGSSDDSVDYLKREFPEVTLIESTENIGFAKANNIGFGKASGQYVVLLNSDAFLVGNSLVAAVELMDRHPDVGLAGGRLIGEDGNWQPSARSYPSIWNDFLTLSGLADRYRRSRIFGRPDMTYIDQNRDLYCDWVPGAFTIIRKEIIERIGLFDERFFLYFEEVDLCKRMRKAGWKIVYWPAITVIHIGGASTSSFSKKLVTKSGMQMSLWRLQSQYLYYRKNHGWAKAFASMAFEAAYNHIRLSRNAAANPEKAEESRAMIRLIDQAWTLTRGGRVSPPKPWKGI
jgi:GT2 family glycosyltransferase